MWVYLQRLFKYNLEHIIKMYVELHIKVLNVGKLFFKKHDNCIVFTNYRQFNYIIKVLYAQLHCWCNDKTYETRCIIAQYVKIINNTVFYVSVEHKAHSMGGTYMYCWYIFEAPYCLTALLCLFFKETFITTKQFMVSCSPQRSEYSHISAIILMCIKWHLFVIEYTPSSCQNPPTPKRRNTSRQHGQYINVSFNSIERKHKLRNSV